jgi:hypothetical protein
MSLADTAKAIGAVTQALKDRLDMRTGKSVTVGRPDKTSGIGEHLNLFLYEVAFDPHLKNTPLNEGEKPPLWLVLKYVLTAFESPKYSDSVRAHELMGMAIRALYQDDLLKLEGLITSTRKPLESNPGELHVTFDESSSDLIAKLTQGTDETPRLSIAFQVRPVMIASGEPGNYSLLVGVDYTKPPALAQPYVGIDVVPSMGARIEELSPTGFEVGDEVAIRGTDLHCANLSVMLGSVELPVTMQRSDELRFTVDPSIIGTRAISAGSYSVMVVQTLPSTGKKRKSNAVIGNLVPTLTSALTPALGPTIIPGTLPGIPDTAYTTINLSGKLLGNKYDDVILALYSGAKIYKTFDVFSALPNPLPLLQPTRQLVMASNDAVPIGDYNIILLVNGQQAPQSPTVHMHKP